MKPGQNMVTARRARDDDADGVFEAHTRSIREVCASRYTSRETEAWAGRLVPGAHLPAIRSHDFFVAEDGDGIAGFSELDPARGEIRAVYVHPRAPRRGVGSALLEAVEGAARAAGLSSLHLSASLNAVPFYEHARYRSERQAMLALTPEVSIICMEMRKNLTYAVLGAHPNGGSPIPFMHAAPQTITTARLILRQRRVSDAPAIYEYGRDPEVTRYMDWRPHATEADARAFIEEAERRWKSGEEYTWMITVNPDDRPIGSVGCRVRGHSADLGYVLSRSHWRLGYATEAARAVLEWASSLEEVYRVWATCDVENAASARVLEKIGMSREGVLRRWAVRPNLPPQPPRDVFVYSWVR